MRSVEGKLAGKTLAEKGSLWKLYLSRWEDDPVNGVRREDVMGLRGEIGERHPVTANRVLKVFRTFCRWAVENGRMRSDPTEGIGKYRESSRTRFLRPGERVRFFEAVGDERTPVDLRDYVMLSLTTGQRSGDVMRMRWEDVDLPAGRWIVRQGKTGEMLSVPLLPEAVEILRRRSGEADGGEYVFASRRKSSRPYVQSLKKSFRALCDRAGIEDFRMHDLRRTLGSWMAIGGASTTIIGRALGHRDSSSTAIYARLTADPVEEAMRRAAREMMDAGSGG